MKIKDTLYKETLKRVGPEEMKGIQRLLADGHTGIAERHTVAKLIQYIRKLEKEAGIYVPKAEDESHPDKRVVKFNIGGSQYYEALEQRSL